MRFFLILILITISSIFTVNAQLDAQIISEKLESAASDYKSCWTCSVVYDGFTCPIDDLEDEIEDLEDEIEDLEDEIERIKRLR